MTLLNISIRKLPYILLLIALLFASAYGRAVAFRFTLDGLPERIDSENKILRVFAKSGCCNHYTDDFEVMPDGTLRQVRTHHLYIDLQTEEWMEVESRWIKGKWQESEPRPWRSEND